MSGGVQRNGDGCGDGLFFVVGPLRTGTSLLARCLDDHPSALCLCESEINRALFDDYAVQLHCQRMFAHGLFLDESISLLDGKKQDDIATWERWYSEVTTWLSGRYEKTEVTAVGDKSPDFFRNPNLVRHLASSYRLIYTVRDPRAVLRSIEVQEDAPPEHKAQRWEDFFRNYLTWKPYLGAPNVLIVRYEDLVTSPNWTMQLVYNHLGLSRSWRFTTSFRRPFPNRFLWQTVVDWETGIGKDFDPSRIPSWKSGLTSEQLARVDSSAVVSEFMTRFGYEA